MQKRRRLFAILLGVGVLAGIIAVVRHEREPKYRGKKLSEWVMEYDKHDTYLEPTPEVDDAIRHMGTYAIPHLLKWLRYEPPTWRKDLANQLFRLAPTRARDALIERITRPTLEPDNQEIRARGAAVALAKLGSKAYRGIPSIVRLANDTNAPASAWRAADVLMELHSLPYTLALLTNTSAKIRDAADDYIESWAGNGYAFGPDAIAAVPSLNHLLDDTNASVASAAAILLMRLAVEGERPVPADSLVHAIGSFDHSLIGSDEWMLFGELSTNADPAVSGAASNACWKIEWRLFSPH